MKFQTEVTVEPGVDCDGRLNEVWATYPNGNRVNLWHTMDENEREQARLNYEWRLSTAALMENSRTDAARDDRGGARREMMRELQREELEAADRRRGVRL